MAQPIAKFKASQISSALLANEISVDGRKVTVRKASVQRRYKDKNGQWKPSTSFSRNEIPLAIYCLEKAFEKIIDTQLDNGDGVVEEEVMMLRKRTWPVWKRLLDSESRSYLLQCWGPVGLTTPVLDFGCFLQFCR